MNQASIKIIHNQKVLMTEQEYSDYQTISRSYDRPHFSGSDLFRGLFHTDDNGNITRIGVPAGAQTSMEIFFFVCALYEHQKMRQWEVQIAEICEKANEAVRVVEKLHTGNIVK